MSTNVELVNEYTGEFAHAEIRSRFMSLLFGTRQSLPTVKSMVDGLYQSVVRGNEIGVKYHSWAERPWIEVSYHTITVPVL